MPELDEMLEISPSKVVHVIARSRGPEVKAEAFDAEAGFDFPDGGEEFFFEDHAGDVTREEFREFLGTLNGDEQASLIALAWIGRGTYAPGELDEAISAAKAGHGTNASAYLFSLPLLPDYLEDAMEQLGISAGEAGGGAQLLAGF